jgi:methyltransferase FkbM-like protein
VPVAAIDDVLRIEAQTLAIKMDVEGFEMETLAGAERLFRSNRGYAQIEAYDGRDAVVIPRMAEFGWRLTGRLDIDFLFEKP